MNLIEGIAAHLEFLGLGVLPTSTRPGTIFWGRMPDSPDTAICVFSTDSGSPGAAHPARIQIYTRARSTREAYELSQRIADLLDGEHTYLDGDGVWVSFEAINTSAGLGADTKQRELYSSNYIVRYCG